MANLDLKYENVGERRHTPFIPPFGLIGIRPNAVLAHANPVDYAERHKVSIRDLKDAVAGFVDSLGGLARVHASDPMDAFLPDDATVADHLAVSEPKFERLLHGKDVHELAERGAYIGPMLVSESVGPLKYARGVVRLAVFIPAPPREHDY